MWAQLKEESARHNRSVFETSSILAVSAVRRAPQGIRWLATSATLGASRTGQVFAAALLNDYRQTLDEIRQVGFVTYAARQFTPRETAVRQFSPGQRTLTERLLDRLWRLAVLRSLRIFSRGFRLQAEEEPPALIFRLKPEATHAIDFDEQRVCAFVVPWSVAIVYECVTSIG